MPFVKNKKKLVAGGFARSSMNGSRIYKVLKAVYREPFKPDIILMKWYETCTGLVKPEDWRAFVPKNPWCYTPTKQGYYEADLLADK